MMLCGLFVQPPLKFHQNFHLVDSSEVMAVRLISASEPRNIWFFFLDKMYVNFIKNFYLAYSSKLMAVRLISASWGLKHLILSF